MKKILIIIMLIVVCVSLSSCSNRYYDSHGDYADGWGGR